MVAISQARTLRRELRRRDAVIDDLTSTVGAFVDTLGPCVEDYPQDGSIEEKARWAERVHDALTTPTR